MHRGSVVRLKLSINLKAIHGDRPLKSFSFGSDPREGGTAIAFGKLALGSAQSNISRFL